MASNPRIDDLRKRLEKDPGSRLFAQLAEELRKAGELEDAILVSREGLQKHPAYPSARMTLGRALFDKGDLGGARAELEGVLKGAADNILASRLLAECLEGLGDLPAAMERYRQTLAMAPGDRQIASKVSALEAKLESASRASVTTPAPPGRTARCGYNRQGMRPSRWSPRTRLSSWSVRTRPGWPPQEARTQARAWLSRK